MGTSTPVQNKTTFECWNRRMISPKSLHSKRLWTCKCISIFAAWVVISLKALSHQGKNHGHGPICSTIEPWDLNKIFWICVSAFTKDLWMFWKAHAHGPIVTEFRISNLKVQQKFYTSSKSVGHAVRGWLRKAYFENQCTVFMCLSYQIFATEKDTSGWDSILFILKGCQEGQRVREVERGLTVNKDKAVNAFDAVNLFPSPT